MFDALEEPATNFDTIEILWREIDNRNTETKCFRSFTTQPNQSIIDFFIWAIYGGTDCASGGVSFALVGINHGDKIDCSSRYHAIQEVAVLLNVSRAYFIEQIIDKAQLPSHRCCNERKLSREDVVLYLKQRQVETETIMARLTSLSQELDL